MAQTVLYFAFWLLKTLRLNNLNNGPRLSTRTAWALNLRLCLLLDPLLDLLDLFLDLLLDLFLDLLWSLLWGLLKLPRKRTLRQG
jgi:hypothetical protein